MAAKGKKTTPTADDGGTIRIDPVHTATQRFHILGTSPLILNRMSQKVLCELLLPRGKKNAAERASSLKHDPLTEYRNSAYVTEGNSATTRLLMLATSFKGALRSVAVDIPGAAKAQIGRLTYVSGDYVPVFGAPRLFMSVVRSADMNHTPDVRTRMIVPEWAATVDIEFVTPLLSPGVVANLLAAAGVMRGVGDWRPEKGSGSFGQFKLVNPTDATYNRILKIGRKEQDALIAKPECYDDESRTLLSWYDEELARRKKIVAVPDQEEDAA